MRFRRGWLGGLIGGLLQLALLLSLSVDLLQLSAVRLCACGMKASQCSCQVQHRRCSPQGGEFSCLLRKPRLPERTAPPGDTGSPDRFCLAFLRPLSIHLDVSGTVVGVPRPALSNLSTPPEPPPPRLSPLVA